MENGFIVLDIMWATLDESVITKAAVLSRERMRLDASFALDAQMLFLLAVAIALQELVDAASGVDQLLLASEERVRRAGDLKLHQGIGLAVDLDGLLAVHRAACDEHLFVRHVLERNFAIVAGMQIFFHYACFFTIN